MTAPQIHIMPARRLYSVILADPAWLYRDKAKAGSRGVDQKYETQLHQKMIDLGRQIDLVAAPDCVLFMWATGPHSALAFDLLKDWGFEYVTKGFCWVKVTKNGKLFWGMGKAGSRANTEDCLMAANHTLDLDELTEDCLMAKRGRPSRKSGGVHQVIMAPLSKHSAKPPETRDRIVQLFGDVPRLELYAREATPGWDAMGLDVGTGLLEDSLPSAQRDIITVARHHSTPRPSWLNA